MKTISHFLPTACAALLMVAVLAGCDDHEAQVKLAREAADRQAAQNREIARQNQELAPTTKRLVEADAESRRELVGLQRDMQAQQAEALKQRDVIEAERKEIAGQRLHESTLVPLIEWAGIVSVIGLVLAYCACLTYGLRSEDGSQQVLNELLLNELADDRMPSLPRVVAVQQFSKQVLPAEDRHRIEHEE